VDGGVLTTTEDHPFWNATDREFQRADQLDAGDQLLSDGGRLIRVIGMRPSSQRVATAYNLTVDDIHTYYVLAGDTPVLVHNSNCNSLTRAQSDDVANFLGYTKTKMRSAGGTPIWENAKAGGGQPRYITYDRTGHHKQAVFKGASFRNPFQSTKDSARDGTYGLDVSPTGEVLGLKWLAK
jgi:hypothetical protein